MNSLEETKMELDSTNLNNVPFLLKPHAYKPGETFSLVKIDIEVMNS